MSLFWQGKLMNCLERIDYIVSTQLLLQVNRESMSIESKNSNQSTKTI
jgi:hypothetical protein